jgi:citrate lyase beta subunit
MPGDDSHKISKATTLGVDCICMDIEDGVAPSRKEAAREGIVQALQTLNFGGSERLVRINALSTGLAEADLAAVLPAHPDGIVLPKILGPEDVLKVDQIMTQTEKEQGWPLNSLALIVLIETARAVVQLSQICGCCSRLQGLILGADDLAVDMGATRTPASWEMFYARSALVMHAVAFNLQAIDLVNVDFRNIEVLRQEAVQGAEMGFTGKQVIHPNQVTPVQEAFTPSSEAVARALEIVQAAEANHKLGKGAFVLNGKMVDTPVIKAAQRVLDRARTV